MKCPNCKNELEYVRVYSQCWQKADVDENGVITDYGSTKEILDTLGIECPFCSEDISNVIKET